MVPTTIQAELIRAAAALVGRRAFDQLVYISDLPPPTGLLKAAAKKLIWCPSSATRRDELLEQGARALLLPGYEMGRQDKFKLALIGAFARGYVTEGEAIVGLVGKQPRSYPDTIHVARIEKAIVDVTPFGEIGGGQLPPAVFDAIIELAVHLGMEGWEGHALGTLFVIGDSARVMEGSRQLALNPFQGYSEEERNLADPSVQDALRGFATLDGGFIVREDGVVLAAGRYLQFPPSEEVKVPLGLGARHMAAALATIWTNATAVVVSQSTGKVRVFRKGRIVLELTPQVRRT
jgi:DNA integrity scanning protein DisA with diadenylate cyclase activity